MSEQERAMLALSFDRRRRIADDRTPDQIEADWQRDRLLADLLTVIPLGVLLLAALITCIVLAVR